MISATNLLVLWVGAAGWALALCNKLPDWAYEGGWFLPRLLRCELCTGTQVGWMTMALWLLFTTSPMGP